MNVSTSLENLYNQHTGLVSDKWELYLAEYERLFSVLRDKPIGLVEIGVQNGGSLEIWSQYFSAAEAIVGCDINPLCSQLVYADERVRLVVGDVTEPETLESILNGRNNFHIVIDDGSHTSSDIIKTFCNLFPRLDIDGIYIVEDLHCSYWEQFQGGLGHPQSSMSFFKTLTDILNFEHWGIDSNRLEVLKPFGITSELSEALLAELHSIEFVNSMCILRKRGKEFNILGRRRVVGTHESVAPVKQVADTFNNVPKQKQNGAAVSHEPFDQSNLDSALALVGNQKERIHKLEERLAELEVELSSAKGECRNKPTIQQADLDKPK